jgi:beta-lactam-binding protein with PASTA domain
VKAHCRLGKVSRVRSTRRAGTVVGQKPRAGRTLARGARVAVLLSRGR